MLYVFSHTDDGYMYFRNENRPSLAGTNGSRRIFKKSRVGGVRLALRKILIFLHCDECNVE